MTKIKLQHQPSRHKQPSATEFRHNRSSVHIVTRIVAYDGQHAVLEGLRYSMCWRVDMGKQVVHQATAKLGVSTACPGATGTPKSDPASPAAYLGVIDEELCIVSQQPPAHIYCWRLTGVACVFLEGKAKHL
eukprot:GHRR01014291.1.p1 GENE.GHRR01014291.1~~GHRR01014291.1.p1  ORF type:complete len:132 (+),score=31.75 GHRR01014291.1:692-1087(+)